MSMSLADDVAVKLASVSGYGTEIYINSAAKLPDGIGPYTHVRDTGGPSDIRVHSRPAAPYRRPTCQVVVHATSAVTAKQKAWAALSALVGIRNMEINDSFYLEMDPVATVVTDIGPDSRGRARFAFNVSSLRQF